MKDSVVRGCLLQVLYERQNEGSIPFGHVEQAVPPPGGISRRDWLRAVAQLSEYRLIDWTPVDDKSEMGLLSGFAKINDLGIKVLEGGVALPIPDFHRREPTNQSSSAATSANRTEHCAAGGAYGGTGERDHRDQSSRCVGPGEKRSEIFVAKTAG